MARQGDSDLDHIKVASTTGHFQGPGTGGRDGSLLDEHPIKFQRCLDREGTRRHRCVFYCRLLELN